MTLAIIQSALIVTLPRQAQMDRRSKYVILAYIILAYSSISVLLQFCHLNMVGLCVFAMVALASILAAVHKKNSA